MSRLAALAASYVGRSVRLADGRRGVITRVNGQGMTVVVPGSPTVRVGGVMAADVAEWLPDSLGPP